MPSLPPLPADLRFVDVVYVLEICIAAAIDAPYTRRQLQTEPLHSSVIQPLVVSLADPGRPFDSQHPGLIKALMIAREDFMRAMDNDFDFQGVGYYERATAKARAYTAELLAARLMYHVSQDAHRISLLTFECPPDTETGAHVLSGCGARTLTKANLECSQLLRKHSTVQRTVERQCCLNMDATFGYNSLELAVRTDARQFLCAAPVQSILVRIWRGDIVFWDSIQPGVHKDPKMYQYPATDMYARLRVPRYRTAFMMVNYAVLLALFCAVLFRERQQSLGPAPLSGLEVMLHIWFAGVIYDEAMQIREAGSLKEYAMDYWSAFDMTIVALYLCFLVLRILAGVWSDGELAARAFEILSLEALLLVPRLFSFLAIVPYFGTLLPCLKELAKEFVKFLSVIIIIYLGFFTTFSFLGRDHYGLDDMSWLLIKVFFGASLSGFDESTTISPTLGPPLMLVFVTLTNIVLVTVLVSILSQKFGTMMFNAREEYVAMFSSTVVESLTTSDRLTYLYPPLNLLGIVMRPLRLCYNHDQYQTLRVTVLRLTHWPLVALIWAYEGVVVLLYGRAGNKIFYTIDAFDDLVVVPTEVDGSTPGLGGVTGLGFASVTI